jgi:hypothetical protein
MYYPNLSLKPHMQESGCPQLTHQQQQGPYRPAVATQGALGALGPACLLSTSWASKACGIQKNDNTALQRAGPAATLSRI